MVSDLIGVRYKTRGRNKEEGFDCYGLAIEVLRREGIELKDVWYSDIKEEGLFNKVYNLQDSIKLEKPKKNCIIVFKEKGVPLHIGVYLGKGEFIHAVVGVGVVISPLRAWENRICGVFQVQ